MRQLNVVIPGLIWPETADYAYLCEQIQAPRLNQLLAKARVTRCRLRYSDLYYRVSPQASSSLAESYAQQLKISGYRSYLLAEPTHLRADRDRLLIAEAELLQLNDSEVTSIIDKLNQHFGPELEFFILKPELWLVGLNFPLPPEVSWPIVDIIGENIDEYLPGGPARLKLHSLLNEIQMLLFNLPLNQERQEQQLLPVNSLWLWNKAPALLPELTSSLVLDGAYAPSCYRDSYAWLTALAEMEMSYAKLWQQQLLAQGSYLNLWVPGREYGMCFHLTRWSLAKLWRQQSWAQIAAQFNLT